MNSTDTPINKLTAKDINSVFFRWALFCQWSFNYETMQSAGVVLTLGKVLRKIYTDAKDYKEALLSHYVFFNTTPYMGNIIMGATLAMEEQAGADKLEKRESIISMKAGLMGPMAGMGDAIFWVIPLTIFNAMAAYSALNGSPYGMIAGLIFGLACIPLRFWMLKMGYKQGTKFMTTLSEQLKSLTSAATVLGIMVVGALIGSVISVYTPLEFTSGEYVTTLQETLDMILPNLLAVLVTGLVYWLLGRKKMTVIRVILIILALSFVGYNIGFLA